MCQLTVLYSEEQRGRAAGNSRPRDRSSIEEPDMQTVAHLPRRVVDHDQCPQCGAPGWMTASTVPRFMSICGTRWNRHEVEHTAPMCEYARSLIDGAA